MLILRRTYCLHLPSDVNRLPRFMNLLTWSTCFQCTVMLQADMIVDLAYTMVKDFVQIQAFNYDLLYHDVH